MVEIQCQPSIGPSRLVNNDGGIDCIAIACAERRVGRAKLAIVVEDTCLRVSMAKVAVAVKKRIRGILRTVEASKVRAMPLPTKEHDLPLTDGSW